jgi:AcrR family transcriptional regulator
MSTSTIEGVGPADDQPAPRTEDGRRARRNRNRDSVVDALLELYREGNLDPSSEEVAARAGLSPRSVFRYFDDVDDLCRAAIARQLDQMRPAAELRIAPDAPLGERIRALVEQRVRLFDAIGSVGVVSRLRAPFQPLIAAQLAESRAFLRGQVQRILAPELTSMDDERAGSVIAAVDVLCSFEAYQLLRFDQRLSRSRASAVLVDAVTSLVGARR